MVNDADLTHRLAGVLERELGKDRVVDLPAQMASEEFLGLPMEATGSRVRWHLLTISRVRRLILVVTGRNSMDLTRRALILGSAALSSTRAAASQPPDPLQS